MKHIKKNAVLMLAMLLVLSGCTAQPEARDKNAVTVCLVQGEGFVAKGYVCHLGRMEDATFQIKLLDGYEVSECSHKDYSLSQSNDGFTILTLKNVAYSTRVMLSCKIPSTVIVYNPNGGTFEATGSSDPLRMAYSPSLHLRFNTLSGEEKLIREGYVMTGWNTEPDGAGQHIGLGSRLTTEKNSTLDLYAQWEKATEEDQFEWRSVEDGIELTAYLGENAQSLVLPERIGNTPVTAIGAGFAEAVTLDRLVIPDTVLRIADGAFRNCRIEHIVFFDTLQQVSDESFSESRPRYWHINAVLKPRYLGSSDITAFADKMDLLMLCANEKKLILFAGCSMFFGMDSQLLADAFPDYTVLNLGAVGGTNAQFQFECILPFVCEGDVFIHAPEQASSYQLMSNTECENRIFIAVEGNFDLLSGVDMTTLGGGAFDCFRNFNSNRRKMEPGTYEDQAVAVNSFGDNAESRNSSNAGRFNEQYGLIPTLITQEGMDRLCDYYDRVRDAGGEVYLSYAPINVLCCSDPAKTEEFSRKWEQAALLRGYETVSKLENYLFDARYFYDTDYHMTNAGALLRSEQLVSDLMPKLSQNAY